MLAEASLLVAVILAVLLIGKGQRGSIRAPTGALAYKQYNLDSQEGFTSSSSHPADGSGDEGSGSRSGGEGGGETAEGMIDLREERDKLLEVLAVARDTNHMDPANPSRSVVRVGMERMIAEIDRALEQEGRYVSPSSVEAIIRSARESFRPL
jgi:hypothetical protein